MTAGDGYVEFTVGETDTLWMGGLSHGNDDTSYADINADGSLDVLAVGQAMTDLDATGGRDDDGDDYEQLPKGNLDVTEIPAERLGGVTTASLVRKGRAR